MQEGTGKTISDVAEAIPRQGQIVPDAGKTMNDVAKAIGEDPKTTQRLLKLNDLIPTLHGVLRQGGDRTITRTASGYGSVPT